MRKKKQIEFIPAGHEEPVTGTVIASYPKGHGRGLLIVEWYGVTLWDTPSPNPIRECLQVINGVPVTGMEEYRAKQKRVSERRAQENGKNQAGRSARKRRRND